jgi:hypothetical protein
MKAVWRGVEAPFMRMNPSACHRGRRADVSSGKSASWPETYFFVFKERDLVAQDIE